MQRRCDDADHHHHDFNVRGDEARATYLPAMQRRATGQHFRDCLVPDSDRVARSQALRRPAGYFHAVHADDAAGPVHTDDNAQRVVVFGLDEQVEHEPFHRPFCLFSFRSLRSVAKVGSLTNKIFAGACVKGREPLF